MNDAAYMTLLTEVIKNAKAVIASDHPDASKLLNDTLKLLSKADRQSRALAGKKPTLEVIRKDAK